MPLVYAPGIGLSTLFLSVVTEQFHGSWQIGLLATYGSGILFLLLASMGLYERVAKAIPYPIRMGIVAGLGLGIVRMGLEAAGVLIKNQNGFYDFGTLQSKEFLCGILGIGCILLFIKLKLRQAITLGLFFTYFIGMVMMFLDFIHTTGLGVSEFISTYFDYRWNFHGLTKVAFQFPRFSEMMDVGLILDFIIVTFIFSITHFFDSVGTVTATTSMIQKGDINFNDQYVKRSITANGVGSIISACLGTSSVTLYSESMIGIMGGGKTGLCAIVVAACMFVALLLAPMITAMTTFVMAPALIVVGLILMKQIKAIDRTKPIERLTSLLVFVYLGLTFRIAEAVLYGMLIYMVLMIISGKRRLLNRSSLLLFGFSIIYILLQLT
jgi:AGZA family xanthine/uracil permease-like MFS transporter